MRAARPPSVQVIAQHKHERRILLFAPTAAGVSVLGALRAVFDRRGGNRLEAAGVVVLKNGTRVGRVSGSEKGVARTKHGMSEALSSDMFREQQRERWGGRARRVNRSA